MKKFFKFKPINFKKSDFCSDVAKEWSWAHIRRHFYYYPQLWLALPVVAVLVFAIIYAICISFDFGVNPLRMALGIMFTSTSGYIIGVVTLASGKIEQEKLEAEGSEPTPQQTAIAKITSYSIGIAALVVLVAMEISDVFEDPNKIIETIGTVITIISAIVPGLLAKFIYR